MITNLNTTEDPEESMDYSLSLEEACSPMIVSGIPDSDEEFIDRWKKFDMLSEQDKDILCSEEMTDGLMRLSSEESLGIEDSHALSVIIRKIFFREIPPKSLTQQLLEYGIRAERAQVIGQKLAHLLSTLKSTGIRNSEASKSIEIEVENLTLSDALKKYPEIGEQLITSDRINIKSFPEPARPSIKNWLADYTFVLGYGTHDAIARANYMFQGTNARNLASADRERLAYVLKAYDENILITVDKNEKKIVFPENNQETRNNNQANFKSQIQNPQMHSSELNSQESRTNLKSSTLGTPSAPKSSAPEAQNPRTMNQEPRTSNISYSSPQKLPYEKMRTQQQPYRITPIYGQQKKEEPKKDERILGKNVVNLREI